MKKSQLINEKKLDVMVFISKAWPFISNISKLQSSFQQVVFHILCLMDQCDFPKHYDHLMPNVECSYYMGMYKVCSLII